MVTFAIVAIITSIALPSYRTLIEKRQVTSGSEQLGAFLSSVQMEAVKRSENISVTYSRTDSDTWCIGIISGTTPCDCTVTAFDGTDACVIGDETQVRVITGASLNYPGIMNAMNGDGDFVYDPGRGLLCDDPDCLAYDNVELELLSEQGSYALNVQLNATGRLKICSDSAGKKLPGFDVCS